MNNKLLAFDLDGTAVNDDYSMSLSSIEAIRKAQDHGHTVAYVSGRRDVDMLTLGDEKWYVDYQILNNGGKIIRCKDKKIIMNQTIDKDTSIRLITYALENRLQLHICNGMIWQVTKMTEGTLNYARKVGVIPEVVDSLDKIEYEAIEGFMATSDLEPIAKFIDENLDSLCYNHSEPGTIDIDDKIYFINQIQYIGDDVCSIQELYITNNILPSLDTINTSVFSFKDILSFYGIRLKKTTQVLRIIEGDKRNKKMFNIPHGVAIMVLECNYYGENNNIIAQSINYIRSDIQSFTVNLHK